MAKLQVEIAVEINLAGKLGKMRSLILGQSDIIIDEVMESWSKTYAKFIRDRFRRASRGDGTWKPLAPSTVKRKNHHRILRDTDLLYNNLDPAFVRVFDGGRRGSRFRGIVSFGGKTQRYPSGVTVDMVITFHNRGGRRLPRREVTVAPDKKTNDKMAADGKRIILKRIR